MFAKGTIVVAVSEILAAGLSPVWADCPYTEYGWTVTAGADEHDHLSAIATDQAGNIYATGAFSGNVDFDPGRGKDIHKTKGGIDVSDICVTSYTSEGLYRWTASMGGRGFDGGFAIATTEGGDLVISGRFSERVDFDPTKRKDKHKSHGGDAFVTLLHEDGSYGWTRTFGGELGDIAYAVAVDSDSNIFVAGRFLRTVDFDPGRGVEKHTSNGNFDAFVIKLNPDGDFIWARTFGGTLPDIAWDLATDSEGNVLVTGEYRGEVDFDPGEGVDLHQSHGEEDAFITKLASDGSYLWTHTFGGVSINDRGDGIAVDSQGNVYVTGEFEASVDFNERGTGDRREAVGLLDVFVTSRAADGSYRWTRTIGGTDIEGGNAIAVTPNDIVVATGSFGGTVDFDPGEGVDERTANRSRDLITIRLTAEGDYLGTATAGGTGTDLPLGLAVDREGDLVLAGVFESQDADFDPTSGIDLHSADDYDLFISKYYCGKCEFIERHTVTSRKRKITSTVRALVPGGKVTVECTGPDGLLAATAKVEDDTATVKFKNLRRGDYSCEVTKLRDADGQVLCNEPTGRRTVIVE